MWLSLRARIHNVHLYQKTMTGPRFLNFLRLLVGHYQNLLLKRDSIKARPFALSVEPTRYCQLKCPECPTGAGILHRSDGYMPIDLFSKIIEETKSYIFHLNLYFQGEPLLHPEITQLVQKASENQIYTSISTNGQNLDPGTCQELVKAGLSRIIISLDGLSQKIYETYRVNGDVEKVKNGIKELILARKKPGSKGGPIIVVQCLAFEHNRHEVPFIRKWCRRQGVDKFELKPAQMNEFGDGSVVPDKRKTRYKKSPNARPQLKNSARNHCWRQWSSAVITWDGWVAPCCYDKDINYPLGNMNEEAMDKIWFGLKRKDFNHLISTNRSSITMCQNCPEGRSRLF